MKCDKVIFLCRRNESCIFLLNHWSSLYPGVTVFTTLFDFLMQTKQNSFAGLLRKPRRRPNWLLPAECDNCGANQLGTQSNTKSSLPSNKILVKVKRCKKVALRLYWVLTRNITPLSAQQMESKQKYLEMGWNINWVTELFFCTQTCSSTSSFTFRWRLSQGKDRRDGRSRNTFISYLPLEHFLVISFQFNSKPL